MEYAKDDYQVLIDAKKLAYFGLTKMDGGLPFPTWTNIPLESLCHYCLFEVLKSMSNNKKKIKIKVIYGESSLDMAFDPEEASGSDFFK